MRLTRWVVAFALGAGLGSAAPAQWTPPPRPTPWPIVRPTPRPTPTPALQPTPTPTPVITPAPSPTTPPTPPPSSSEKTPLLRLYPAPLLVSKPPIGGLMLCGPVFAPFGCTPGTPAEVQFIHTEGEPPAVYQFIRVR